MTLRSEGRQQGQPAEKDFTAHAPSPSPIQLPPGAARQQAEASAAAHGLQLLQVKQEAAALTVPSGIVVISMVTAGLGQAC